jgi:hypothetical protein
VTKHVQNPLKDDLTMENIIPNSPKIFHGEFGILFSIIKPFSNWLVV